MAKTCGSACASRRRALRWCCGPAPIMSGSHHADRDTCLAGLCILLTLTADCARNRPRKRLNEGLLEGALLAIHNCCEDAKCILNGCRLLQRIYTADDSKETMLRIEMDAVPVLAVFCTKPTATHAIIRLTQEIALTVQFSRTHKKQRYKTFDD